MPDAAYGRRSFAGPAYDVRHASPGWLQRAASEATTVEEVCLRPPVCTEEGSALTVLCLLVTAAHGGTQAMARVVAQPAPRGWRHVASRAAVPRAPSWQLVTGGFVPEKHGRRPRRRTCYTTRSHMMHVLCLISLLIARHPPAGSLVQSACPIFRSCVCSGRRTR